MTSHSGIAQAIDALPEGLREQLVARGFDANAFIALAARVRNGTALEASRLGPEVQALDWGGVARLPAAGSGEEQILRERGEELLRSRAVALVVMAGGMATRMGGVVKALVELWPGRSFLDIRLAERAALKARYGTTLPLWWMSSFATDAALREALSSRGVDDAVTTFEQNMSLRLTSEGDLFLDDDGTPSCYATGHGDLPEALERSGLLTAFRAQGGRFVWVVNVDNLAATVDPVVLAAHAQANVDVTVEVVPRLSGDKGGMAVTDGVRASLAEDFRLPPGFQKESAAVFNTNTLLFNVESLEHYRSDWTWVPAVKEIAGRKAVQCERLIGEVTSHLKTQFLCVPRESDASRFLPIKDVAELDRMREPLAAALRARGIMPNVSGVVPRGMFR